jgi:hypothetical protein
MVIRVRLLIFGIESQKQSTLGRKHWKQREGDSASVISKSLVGKKVVDSRMKSQGDGET